MPLAVAFETRWLRDICEDDRKAEREFGKDVAEALKARLADLRAVRGVNDLFVGNPRKNTNDQYYLDLCDGYRLVYVANHPNNPMLKSGRVNWSKVRRIKIVEIGQDEE